MNVKVHETEVGIFIYSFAVYRSDSDPLLAETNGAEDCVEDNKL